MSSLYMYCLVVALATFPTLTAGGVFKLSDFYASGFGTHYSSTGSSVHTNSSTAYKLTPTKTTNHHNTRLSSKSVDPSSRKLWSKHILSTGTPVVGTGGLRMNSTTGPVTSAWYNTADTCWQQWDEYWSVAKSYPDAGPSCTWIEKDSAAAPKTVYGYGHVPTATIIHSYHNTRTYTNPGGTFAILTAENTWTSTEYEYATVETDVIAVTPSWTDTYSCGRPSVYSSTPTCKLETGAIATHLCISRWHDYLNPSSSTEKSATTPWCRVGSLNAEQCQAAITSVYHRDVTYGETNVNAWTTASFGAPPVWNQSYAVAPSCTLGCQACAITGNRVKLLYWPAPTGTWNGTNNRTNPAFWRNNTVSLGQLPPMGRSSKVVAYIDDTTLTSPTIYISYETLYASDSCSGVGSTYSNTIIPLPSDQLSSLNYNPITTAPPLQWNYATASFNLNDLYNQDPAFRNELYSNQPWCRAERRQAGDLVVYAGHCVLDVPYAPIIAIPTAIASLDPAWNSCGVWYGGLYDPPSALEGATIVAPITTPYSVHAWPTHAAPSSSVAAMPAKTTPWVWTWVSSHSKPALLPTTTFTAGGMTFTAVPPASAKGTVTVILQETTVRLVGKHPQTVAGQIISLQPSGAGIVVGTKTIAFPSQTKDDHQGSLINTSGGQVIIKSQTLSPGGSGITVDGNTYSLASGGTAMFVNGHETAIARQTGTPGTNWSYIVELLSEMMTLEWLHGHPNAQGIDGVPSGQVAGGDAHSAPIHASTTGGPAITPASEPAQTQLPAKPHNGAMAVEVPHATFGILVALGILAVL